MIIAIAITKIAWHFVLVIDFYILVYDVMHWWMFRWKSQRVTRQPNGTMISNASPARRPRPTSMPSFFSAMLRFVSAMLRFLLTVVMMHVARCIGSLLILSHHLNSLSGNCHTLFFGDYIKCQIVAQTINNFSFDITGDLQIAGKVVILACFFLHLFLHGFC